MAEIFEKKAVVTAMKNIGEMLNLENFPHVKKVCMIKNGQMIFEHTRENEKGTPLFSVGCIFKSFLSVLVGIALYEGKIRYGQAASGKYGYN